MSALTLSSSCQDMGALLAQLQRNTQEVAQLKMSCTAYARSRKQLGCAKDALASSVEQQQEKLRKGRGLPKDKNKAKLLIALFTFGATQKDLEGLPDEFKPHRFIPQADQQIAQNGEPS